MASGDREYIQEALPVGSTIMYDANDWVNNDTIPGWYACDGLCGTPDLTDTFLLGGISSCIGARGGCNSIAIDHCHDYVHTHGTEHCHAIEQHCHAVPDHGHGQNFCFCVASEGTHCHMTYQSHGAGGSACGILQHYISSWMSYNMWNVGSHSHTFSVTTGGSDTSYSSTESLSSCSQNVEVTGTQNCCYTIESESDDSRPAFYSVIFIMKKG